MTRLPLLLVLVAAPLSADSAVVRVGATLTSEARVTVEGWAARADVAGAEPAQAAAAVVLPSGLRVELAQHTGEWIEFDPPEGEAYAAR